MRDDGTPSRIMGRGEGHTCLVLTDADSRLLRRVLDMDLANLTARELEQARLAFNRGIMAATARIKAEFDDEQKRRKAKQT